MNIFLFYHEKIFTTLKKLEKKKVIKIPKGFKGFTIELPPRNENAALSCNAALVLSKHNNIPSIDLAKILRENLLTVFKEFKTIEVAGPGFLNINFDKLFWRKYLLKVIHLNTKYGNK